MPGNYHGTSPNRRPPVPKKQQITTPKPLAAQRTSFVKPIVNDLPRPHPNLSHTRPHLGVFEITPPAISQARPGHIYLYTFLHLLESDKRSDLGIYVTNHPSASKNERDVPVAYVPRKLLFIMVKIGMTTQRVDSRIRQWRDQCRCDITQLGPGHDKFRNLKDKSAKGWLARRFSSLSIVDYSTYDKEQRAFHCAQNVARAEREIHETLGKLLGRVNFNCLGCSLDGTYKTHVEWFWVPKDELRKVYRIIDKCCKR